MKDWQFFLNRCLASIEQQTFKNYEVILVNHSNMPITSNRAIESCTGEIIKVLYMDDYFAHENALKNIVDAYPFSWLVTACNHDINGTQVNEHKAVFDGVLENVNSIGSPSVLAFKKDCHPTLFDEKLSWVLDTDLYKRLYFRYGKPKIIDDVNVTIGIHEGQMTNLLTEEQKQYEQLYLVDKKI